VEFFLLAFTDAGDVALDPFMGSGTTMAAAEVLGRVAYGCEISPGYCDVILRRLMNLSGATAALASTGQTFVDVAAARGVPVDQALNPKASDSRAIKHHGPNPHYGPKRKAS
jgi:tRNA G10  N-methylase Trm11